MRPYIQCQTNTSFDQILKYIVPRGYILPVVTGTKFVTVGGALSNNIHGKNCFNKGAIGEYTKSFELLLASGEIVFCSRYHNEDLFYHVIGGQGLLGIIIRVQLYIDKLISYEVENSVVKTKNLESSLNIIENEKYYQDYIIGNVDLFSSAKYCGRSKIILSKFCANEENKVFIHSNSESNRLEVFGYKFLKYVAPLFINDLSINIANRLSFISSGEKNKTISFSKCHFLMDYYLPFYNELFPKGFYEYQVIFSKDKALEGFHKMVELQKKYQAKSIMTSLKAYRRQFDKFKNSFSSLDGFSQTYDIPKTKNSKFYRDLFYKMNDEVIKREGRIYLGKTSCLTREQLLHMYPEMDSLLKLKSRLDSNDIFRSHFYERVILRKEELNLNF